MNALSKRRPLKVFLCHAHADGIAIRVLYKRLKRDRIEPWLDGESLMPGQNWEREIRVAILKSDVILICLSNTFNEKRGFRHEELKIALRRMEVLSEEDIFIIPVHLEKCEMPASLRHLHRVDLFEEDGYGKLLKALRKQASFT